MPHTIRPLSDLQRRQWLAAFARGLRTARPGLTPAEAKAASARTIYSAFLLTPAEAVALYLRQAVGSPATATHVHSQDADLDIGPVHLETEGVPAGRTMPASSIKFQHGSQALPNGRFLGTVTFTDARGREIPISYPEQFDTAEEAAAHAYREAVTGRAVPFKTET